MWAIQEWQVECHTDNEGLERWGFGSHTMSLDIDCLMSNQKAMDEEPKGT